MKYILKTGAVFSNRWGGSFTSTGLLFNSIEDVETVIELTKPPAWAICSLPENDSPWHDVEVKVASIVEKTRQEDKEGEQRHINSMKEQVLKINKQPTEVVFNFGTSLKVIIYRQEATYNSSKSRYILVPIHCKIFSNDKIIIQYFAPSEFLSKDGRVLAKKLHWLCNCHKELFSYDIDFLAKELKTLKAVIDALHKGTYESKQEITKPENTIIAGF